MFRRLRYHLELRARRTTGPPPTAERTWIHPSELPGSFEAAAMPPRRSAGSRRFVTVVAAAAALLFVTGGALLIPSTGSEPAGASTGPHVATSIEALPAADRASAGAMLALAIYEGDHLGTATAMVIPPGDLAVTTTPVPRGASVMGRVLGEPAMPLQIVGTDPQLGITVLRLSTSADVTPIGPLGPAISTGGAPTALTALASVRGASTATELDYAAAYLSATPSAATVGRSVISVTHGRSLAGVIAGTLVLNARGQAVAAQVPKLGATTFVPATFLRLLAQRIVLGSPSGHGWLQVYGPPTATSAARVAGVTYGGAAWGRLRPGDTIVAMDAQRVRSMADVGSILYTSAPGEPLAVTVLRGGHRISVSVVLAAQP